MFGETHGKAFSYKSDSFKKQYQVSSRCLFLTELSRRCLSRDLPRSSKFPSSLAWQGLWHHVTVSLMSVWLQWGPPPRHGLSLLLFSENQLGLHWSFSVVFLLSCHLRGTGHPVFARSRYLQMANIFKGLQENKLRRRICNRDIWGSQRLK